MEKGKLPINAVHIDFDEPVYFGSDQINLSYPTRFATVDFALQDTEGLTAYAEKILAAELNIPDDRDMEPSEDTEGWYEFFIGLQDYKAPFLDTCIGFRVTGGECFAEDTFYIDLSEDEQTAVYEALDMECKEHLGKGCQELLAESRRRLETEGQEEEAWN